MRKNTSQPLCRTTRLLLLSSSLSLLLVAWRSPKGTQGAPKLPAADSVGAVIYQVNQCWQAHSNPGYALWDNATRHTRNMAACSLTKGAAHNYSERWAIQDQWTAAAIKPGRQPAGYWTRSLPHPQQAPGPATSGTAFFMFGILWGINQGSPDRATCLPVAQVSWQYLTATTLQPDGRVAFAQPIGVRAMPGQVFDRCPKANFGVGPFCRPPAKCIAW